VKISEANIPQNLRPSRLHFREPRETLRIDRTTTLRSLI
jgi:hypothetical protein